MEKREILEKLAKKEISKEEAEKLLTELGDPIPETPPSPITKQKPKKGCLIALIIGIIMIPLIILFTIIIFFASSVSSQKIIFRNNTSHAAEAKTGEFVSEKSKTRSPLELSEPEKKEKNP